MHRRIDDRRVRAFDTDAGTDGPNVRDTLADRGATHHHADHGAIVHDRDHGAIVHDRDHGAALHHAVVDDHRSAELGFQRGV